jgi:hypothetical protein
MLVVSAMKRPVSIYLIAAWCFVGLMRQITSLLYKLAYHIPEDSQGWSQSLYLLGLILVIWHTVRLVQLKSFNLWLSIVFFVLSTLTIIWNSFALLHRFPDDPARPIATVSVFGALNLASVWYLARPGFRTFAAEFVAARKAAKTSPVSQGAPQGKAYGDLER